MILRVNTGLFRTRYISYEEIKPKAQPNITAPTVNSKNSLTMNKAGGIVPLTSYKLIVYKTIHDPSLNKLSPSIKELNFLGAPASLSKAKTATVSVHESTDPNINASE